MRDSTLFAFAGLWERWQGGEQGVVETCAILTCEPNELMSPIHNRMPVILEPSDYDLWLDTGVTDTSALKPLMKSYPSDRMTAYPVSAHVNTLRHDDPSCIVPLVV